MTQDSKLNELYKKRNNFYPKLLTQYIAIPVIAFFFLLFGYWTAYELIIWTSGERTETEIIKFFKARPDEYYLTVSLDGTTVKKEIEKRTFESLQANPTTNVIYWKNNPRKSIFLQLSGKYDVFRFLLGVVLTSILLFGTIKRIRTLAKENPDK